MDNQDRTILVSVIVPVYNSEKYLEQCLDSICAQTLKDIEIICVDDGSTDQSPQILQRYQEQDARIKVLRQENQYAGIARNNGMQNADGEYLVFWDSDDFFAPKALETLYQKITETGADICVCGASQYLESKNKSYPYNGYMNKTRIPETECFNRESNPDYILNFTNVEVWNKMYRRRFLEEKGIRFDSIRVGEDVVFSMTALCLAEKITTIPTALVNYRKNSEGGLVGTVSERPLEPFMAWVELAEYLDKNGIMPEKSFVNRVVGTIRNLLRRLQTEEAFTTAIHYLQGENLGRLHLKERETDYYYHPEYAQFVTHILTDEPWQFQTYLTNSTFVELTEKVAEIRGLKKDNGKNKKKKLELQKENDEITAQLSAALQELEEVKKNHIKLEKKLQMADEKLKASERSCQQMKNERDVNRREADKIRNSMAYRLGRMILWLPGKIRGIFKKK